MRLRFEHGRRDELKTLHPAYFAMVMATGIVSIAAHLQAFPWSIRMPSPPTSKATAAA
jgi:tellurite resistance protein TehA-like permease